MCCFNGSGTKLRTEIRTDVQTDDANIRCPGGSFRPGIKKDKMKEGLSILRSYANMSSSGISLGWRGRDPLVFISLSLHKHTFDTIVSYIVKYVGDWESDSACPSMMGSRLL